MGHGDKTADSLGINISLKGCLVSASLYLSDQNRRVTGIGVGINFPTEFSPGVVALRKLAKFQPRTAVLFEVKIPCGPGEPLFRNATRLPLAAHESAAIRFPTISCRTIHIRRGENLNRRISWKLYFNDTFTHLEYRNWGKL